MRQLARTANARITLDDSGVARAMARLNEAGTGEAVRKKALRNAMRPFVKLLRLRWQSASFKRGGRGLHRAAIVSATLSDVRRRGAKGAPVAGTIGVQYGRRGGAKARGFQRVYHLIEAGFVHYATGRRIPGRNISAAWANGRLPLILERIRVELLAQIQERMQG